MTCITKQLDLRQIRIKSVLFFIQCFSIGWHNASQKILISQIEFAFLDSANLLISYSNTSIYPQAEINYDFMNKNET